VAGFLGTTITLKALKRRVYESLLKAVWVGLLVINSTSKPALSNLNFPLLKASSDIGSFPETKRY
jgi:hypothetical protein